MRVIAPVALFAIRLLPVFHDLTASTLRALRLRQPPQLPLVPMTYSEAYFIPINYFSTLPGSAYLLLNKHRTLQL